jgi:hypothetical protein
MGAGISDHDHTMRYRVTQCVVSLGIPTRKMDGLRHLVERGGCQLAHSSRMVQQYVPMIEEEETELLRAEVVGQHVSIMFDGTSRLGEAINIIFRWCGADFRLVQRLTKFVTLARHVDHNELARMMSEHILLDMHVTVRHVIALARDSVALNGATLSLMQGVFNHSQDMLDVPHTISNAGIRITLPTLDRFMRDWYLWIYSSTGGKSLLRSMFGERVVGLSAVRWYSKAEIMEQLHKHFELLEDFLARCGGLDSATATVPRLTAMLADADDYRRVHLQLAAVLHETVVVCTGRQAGAGSWLRRAEGLTGSVG